MKRILLLLFALCALNSLFAQFSYVSGTSGPIYYTGGNVGIGTNSPTASLDDAGTCLLRSGLTLLTSPSSNLTGYFRGPATGTTSCNVIMQANNGGGNAFWLTAAPYYLKIGTAGGNEAASQSPIDIDYTGNVGINTLCNRCHPQQRGPGE